MKQVPDSLLAFQHMFPDDDACAAWLIEMRWPDGFAVPRAAMKRDGRCAGTHLRVRRLPPADLGDGRDDPARQQAAAHRLVLGRLPDGDPLQRHLCPAAPETARYRLLPQRLAARPKLPSMVDPEREPVVGPGGNRRGQPSIPELSILRPRARTQPRRQDAHRRRHRTRGRKHPRPPAAPKSPPTAPPTSDTSSKCRRDAIAKTDGWSGYAAVPADRHNVHVVGKTAAHLRPAVDPPSLLQPQRMGARRLPRAASDLRHLGVRLSLQPPATLLSGSLLPPRHLQIQRRFPEPISGFRVCRAEPSCEPSASLIAPWMAILSSTPRGMRRRSRRGRRRRRSRRQRSRSGASGGGPRKGEARAKEPSRLERQRR